MRLLAELQRRKVFKVGAAYLVVAWLVVQGASIGFPAFEAPPWALRVFILVLMLGFPIALVMAWVFETTPDGVVRETRPAGSVWMYAIAATLAVAAVGWFVLGRSTETGSEMGSESISGSVASTATGPAPPKIDSGLETESGTLSARTDLGSAGVTGAESVSGTGAVSQRSVAVLPFVNMSGDAEQEYFADGLSEEILNSLTRIDGMQVAGRTSSFQFKGKNEDLRDIGRKLGVASVLEGSVRRGKDTMRVTAQLVRVSDGIHVWSQAYDRAPDDTLAVQLDIAEHVAGALDVVLDDEQRERMRQSGVKNVEAFIAFQKGRQLYNEAHDPARSNSVIATLRKANVEFARATELEPDFAAAYYVGVDLYGHVMLAIGTSTAERAAALEAGRRYLALAARHVHDASTRQLIQADRQLVSDDWRGIADRLEAAADAQRCVQANWLLVSNIFGFAADRLVAMQRLVVCDPLAALPYYQTATSANWAGRPEVAIEFAERGEAAMGGSDSVGMQKVRALVSLGRIDEAQTVVAGLTPGSAERMIGELAVAAASGGDVADVAARSRAARRLGWNPEYWEVGDFLAEALLDDRMASNRRVAAVDAEPGGPLKLATMLSRCQCGAPFDLDAAPNFKARLTESGLPWPPVDLIAGLRKKESAAP